MQDRNFLDEYREHGYIPTSKTEGKQSVSRTLEYAYDDWCVGQMAKQLGKKDDAALFAKRAQNYRNVFDPAIGFMRGKLRRRQVARAVRPARSSFGPTTPRPPRGTTPGSCRRTCPA